MYWNIYITSFNIINMLQITMSERQGYKNYLNPGSEEPIPISSWYRHKKKKYTVTEGFSFKTSRSFLESSQS